MKKIKFKFCRSFTLIISTFLLQTGFSQNNIHINKLQLDSLLASTHKNERSPGYGLIIIHKGEIAYAHSTGMANIKENIPIGLNTQFNIGSVTKQFTAMCILLLEETGKLKCTDEIHIYLPELPDYGYPITINHLLSHTSGIRDYLEVMSLINKSSEKNLSNERMISYQHNLTELNFPPGERFTYSNTGYMLLVKIIERASGKSYAEYAEENIFTPLGMNNTYIEPERKQKLHDGTKSYRVKAQKIKAAKVYSDALGATGVNSTLHDMHLWDQNFKHNILGKKSKELIKKMETTFLLNNGTHCNYALGLVIKNYRGYQTIEHAGGWTEYLTQYRRFPSEDVSVIVASNTTSVSPFNLCDKICNVILKNISIGKEQIKNNAYLPSPVLSGTYLSEDNFLNYVVQNDTDIHLINKYGNSKTQYRLTYVQSKGDSVIEYIDSTNNIVTFYIASDTASSILWSGNYYFVYPRAYARVQTNNTHTINQFTGKYYSEEFERNIKIKYHKKKESLFIHPFPFISYQLVPVGYSIFSVANEKHIIRFQNNTLIAGDDWIYNFKFNKIK
ncbi:MAG: beta-lactamase family protein [Fimbriimonadaceae bacterium]|nr:beta-lactamase family protein [Chitinophagales bacterium]